MIEDYVDTFCSNLIYLQTLLDSYNSDEETRIRTRTMAGILGYGQSDKISLLHAQVTKDYRSLHWV